MISVMISMFRVIIIRKTSDVFVETALRSNRIEFSWVNIIYNYYYSFSPIQLCALLLSLCII